MKLTGCTFKKLKADMALLFVEFETKSRIIGIIWNNFNPGNQRQQHNCQEYAFIYSYLEGISELIFQKMATELTVFVKFS